MAGRHYESVQAFAASFQAQAIPIMELSGALAQTDIMICATASRQPIVNAAMLAPIIQQRMHSPIFIADLAVPRDVSEDVDHLQGVHLYNIDDLQGIVEKNIKGREAAVEQAESMVALHAENYQRQLRLLSHSDLITQYRQRVDEMRENELQKALRLLDKGHDAEAVLRQFSQAFTKKLLHQPTRKLREFVSQEMVGALRVMKEFLEL